MTDGIPPTLPALSLAGELGRKAATAGLEPTSREALEAQVSALLPMLVTGDGSGDDTGDGTDAVTGTRSDRDLGNPGGELLLAAAELVRRSGADPELSLRRAAGELRARLRHAEGLGEDPTDGRDGRAGTGSLGVPRGAPGRR